MEKFATMTTRQKVTLAIIVVVLIFLLWQIIGLFRGSSPAPTPKPVATNGAPVNAQPQPLAAELPKPKTTAIDSQREAELMRLQQETEAKYLAAVNELQMLKISQQIAEANQAIVKAKLATISAQKDMVNLLSPTPVTTATYANNLANPSGRVVPASAMQPNQAAPAPTPEVTYTVISVSQLQYKWTAVLGYQGNLYNVSVGDVLPADQSTVMSIDRSGVILEKNGAKKKISLVPII